MNMRLTSLDYNTWGTPRMTLTDGDTIISFNLSEEDREEIRELANRIFLRRQPAVVQAVANAQPALPAPIDTEFTEVDDVNF